MQYADLLGLEEPASPHPPQEDAQQKRGLTINLPGLGSSTKAAAHDNLATIAFDTAQEVPEERPSGGGDKSYWDNFTDTGSSGREYSVKFEGGPIGLVLEPDFTGREVCVKGFTGVQGSDGKETCPALECRAIAIGDVLTHVDGQRVGGMSIAEVVEELDAACSGGGAFSLQLNRLGAKGGDQSRSGVDSDISLARRFIHEMKVKYYTPPPPPPETDMIYCSLERHRGEKVTSFHLIRDDTGEFVLACSVDADLLGPMIFHTIRDSHLRTMRDISSSTDSAAYIGCLVPNFLGTEFRIFDHRLDPRDKDQMEASEKSGAHELALIMYEVNVLGRVPNFMRIVIPRPLPGKPGPPPSNHGTDSLKHRWDQLQKTRSGEGPEELSVMSPVRSFRTMLRRLSELDDDGEHRKPPPPPQPERTYSSLEVRDSNDLIVFETKKPTWNESLNAWTLNFNGRVKIPSKKNFLAAPPKGDQQAEAEFGEGRVHIRHGKMSKSRFSVDFHNPISPIVALGVCCSTFSLKRIVT